MKPGATSVVGKGRMAIVRVRVRKAEVGENEGFVPSLAKVGGLRLPVAQLWAGQPITRRGWHGVPPLGRSGAGSLGGSVCR